MNTESPTSSESASKASRRSIVNDVISWLFIAISVYFTYYVYHAHFSPKTGWYMGLELVDEIAIAAGCALTGTIFGVFGRYWTLNLTCGLLLLIPVGISLFVV